MLFAKPYDGTQRSNKFSKSKACFDGCVAIWTSEGVITLEVWPLLCMLSVVFPYGGYDLLLRVVR